MMIGYVLLALGVAVFVLSFVIPAKTEEEKKTELSEDLIRDLVEKEVESAKGQITDLVDETIHYAMEKTERSMDRLTNEKMMAVNEYSDTVLSEINKNHQEVVFLYDMLNDKHENLKDTVASVEKTASEVRQTVRDAELTAKETKEQVEEAKEAADILRTTENISVAPDFRMPEESAAAPEIDNTFEGFTVESFPEVPAPTVEPEPDDTADAFAFAADTFDEEPEREISAGELFFGEKQPEIEYPQPNGRMSAIDRLKAATAGRPKVKEAEEAQPEAAQPKRKRTQKPKVREEAVSFGDLSEPRLDNNGLEIIKSDAENELLSYVATKVKPEGPDLNLGENPVGKTGGRNNNDRILELHSAGKSNMAIAKELGLGIGEVKLVIDLFEGM